MISLLIGLILYGFIAYLVFKFIPMAEPIKQVLMVVLVIILIIWLLQLFGLGGQLGPLPRLR